MGKRKGLEDMVSKYVITSAQLEARPNKELLRNMESYAAENDAKMLVLPIRGQSVKDERLHPDLASHPDITFINRNYNINDNFKISNYEIRPQQINPLTGLKRFAQGDKSFVFGSPKQHLEYVANSYDDIPKAIMTTGSLTQPRYNERVRTGRIAKQDHQYGFVVAEVEDNKHFHFRQVRALKNGSFTDLMQNYKKGEMTTASRIPALVVGDLHPYDTDPVHEAATFNQIQELNPDHVFLHDTFNGISISHHYKNNNIEYFRQSQEQGLNLEEELKFTASKIQEYLGVMRSDSKLHIVASNHDEWLYRYLDEGRFIRDKGNDLIASKLYTATLEGKNPLKAGLEMFMPEYKNLDFIERGDGFKLRGFELGHHGDLGSNGGRGSKRSIEEANGKSITGHGHSAFAFRDTYRVGTSTFKRLRYNQGGYSNWTNTNAALYDNKTVALLNTINGNWKK